MSLADKFNIPKSLFETIVKMNKESADYQAKVKALMAKKGIRSLGDLSPEEKKDFFNTLDAMHKAKNEEVELDEAIPKSTGYALIHSSSKKIVAKGNKEEMMKKMKEANAKEKGSHHLGMTYRGKVGDTFGEEVELDEAKSSTGYDLYHKDFSSAMQHAYDFAKKKYNIEIDPLEIDRNVAMGPKKPSSGKANAYRLLDKTGKKAIQVQVANLDNKRYELNMYKEDLDLDESADDVKKVGEKIARYAQALRPDHMDKKDLMKVASLLKQGKKKEAIKFASDLDSDPRDYVIHMMDGLKEDIDLDEAKSDEKVKVVGNDENGDFYINPITGKKVYQSGVKRGDRVNPKTGKVSNAFGASPADRLNMRKEEVEMKDFLVKFEKDGKVSAKNYTAKSELDAESKAKVDAKRMGMRVASVRLKEDFDLSEAEGGGTTVDSAERAKATAERAKLTLQSAMLRMKQAKEREAIQKKKESIKEEVQAPFSGSKTVKPNEQKKDKYGNVIKNVAKHLAKKAMTQQSQKKEEVEEGKKFGYEKYQETSKKVTGKTPEERTKEIEDIQAKLKQQKAEFEARHSKKAMKEAYSLFMEAVKAKKEATAKDKEKSVKAGDKLSGKSEPIVIDPEVK